MSFPMMYSSKLCRLGDIDVVSEVLESDLIICAIGERAAKVC